MTRQQEWYWNDQEWDKQDIDTTVVLRLSKNFNTAAMIISEKLGFESIDEYVSDIVRLNVRTELEGLGNFEKEDAEDIEKQIALIDVHRHTDRLIEV